MKQLLESLLEISIHSQGIRSFWLLPNGKRLEVADGSTHAEALLKNPGLFGLSKAALKNVKINDYGTETIGKVVLLGIEKGGVTVTYSVSNKTIDVVSKRMDPSTLDEVLSRLSFTPEEIMWDTPTDSRRGSVEDFRDRF